MVWSGLVWSGLVWSGLVWSGLVLSGLVWSGLVWSGLVWCGLVWSGLVWSGLVWSGLVWSGLVWSPNEGVNVSLSLHLFTKTLVNTCSGHPELLGRCAAGADVVVGPSGDHSILVCGGYGLRTPNVTEFDYFNDLVKINTQA